MELIKDIDFVIGKKYSFPQCSTKETTIDKTIESYLIFHDDKLEWRGKYKAAYHKEEEGNMGIEKDVERDHDWLCFLKREQLMGLDGYKWYDEELWAIKIVIWGAGDVVLAFYSEEVASKMYSRIWKYIFEPMVPALAKAKKMDKQSAL